MATPAAELLRDSPRDPPTPAGARSAVWLAVTWVSAALPLAALRGLSLDRSFSPSIYLPLHIAAELAIVIVGFSTAAVQWYAAGARGLRHARARFIGAAFLGAALLETLHLLVYPGMPGLLGAGTVERGIYYWLTARFWLTGSLLAAAFIPPQSDHPLLRRAPLLALNLGIALLGFALEHALPAAPGLFFHAGTGLTPVKIALEAALALVAAAGAILHLGQWRATGERASLRLSGALGVIVLCEICFSLYASAYDVYNLLGHAYALLAAGLVFDGLFIAALIRPYERLDRATSELAASNARLDALRAHVEGELAVTIERLEEARAREALARAELEAALAAVPDAIVVYGPDGRILRMNEAARELLRYAPDVYDDSVAARWARLDALTTEGKPLAHEHNPVIRALRGEVVAGLPLSIAPAHRKRTWVTLSAAPTRGPDGRLTGAVLAAADVSVMQALQSQREDLLRAVSHDLRNPLQIVLLQAERIQRLLGGTDRDRERLGAERIARAAKAMGVMIRDLVEAARMEGGKLALQRQPVELKPFLVRVLHEAAGALDVGRVALEIPEGLPRASADPARLERIVTNLVANALKYSPSDARVTVTAEARDGAVAISVKDRGPGIPPEDLPRIFERFYRGKSTQKADGLGLGLYIVEMLVDAHGGRVQADSRPGEGATFTFTLPAAD
jgi:signal transduction histidine kinase